MNSEANKISPERRSAPTRTHYKTLPPSQQPSVMRLLPEQRAQLVQWLQEGTTYAEAVRRLRERFAHETNITSLCRWWIAQIQAEPDKGGCLLDVTVDVRGTPVRIQVSIPRKEGQS